VTRDEYQLQFDEIFDQAIAYAKGTASHVVDEGALRRPL
jgi:hypothetical protein